MFQPLEQRRAEVEADPLVAVDDAGDPPPAPRNPGRAHGAVALLLDPFVPVVKRRGRELRLHFVQPRILPRGLVEVAVDDDRVVGRGHWGSIADCRLGLSPSVCRPRSAVASRYNCQSLITDQSQVHSHHFTLSLYSTPHSSLHSSLPHSSLHFTPHSSLLTAHASLLSSYTAIVLDPASAARTASRTSGNT